MSEDKPATRELDMRGRKPPGYIAIEGPIGVG